MDLKAILTKYVENLKEIYGDDLLQVSLFGSYARGDYGSDSDIDILVIVKGNKYHTADYNDSLCGMSVDFNMEHDVWVQAIDMDSEYFYKWKDASMFLRNVKKDEIRLYGGEGL